jgi:hypothetical protein
MVDEVDQGVEVGRCPSGRSAGLRPEPASGLGHSAAVSNATHTPLPWALSYGFSLPRISRSASYIAPASPEIVGIKLATPWVEGAWDDDEEAAANAEFIVRACNAYYELREALVMCVGEMARARGRLETIASCNEDRRIAASLGSQCDFVRSILSRGASGIEGEAEDPQWLHPEGESPVGAAETPEARP